MRKRIASSHYEGICFKRKSHLCSEGARSKKTPVIVSGKTEAAGFLTLLPTQLFYHARLFHFFKRGNARPADCSQKYRAWPRDQVEAKSPGSLWNGALTSKGLFTSNKLFRPRPDGRQFPLKAEAPGGCIKAKSLHGYISDSSARKRRIFIFIYPEQCEPQFAHISFFREIIP